MAIDTAAIRAKSAPTWPPDAGTLMDLCDEVDRLTAERDVALCAVKVMVGEERATYARLTAERDEARAAAARPLGFGFITARCDCHDLAHCGVCQMVDQLRRVKASTAKQETPHATD